jgi:APA family basic amino acid/polyamine antiporter
METKFKSTGMTKLKRTLNLPEVIFFACGVILGAGIYAVIGKAAGHGGNMLWLSFFISAATALLTIFAYAELSSGYPKAGGEFFYVKEIIGIKSAYFVGFIVSMAGIIAGATISIGFAGYLSELIEINKLIASLCIIGLILLINILGIRHSSVVNIIFTIIETCGLLFVIYSAAPDVGTINYTELPPEGITGILVGAALCFFAFTGFEDCVKLAEETKQPEKNIPRGLLISAVIITLIYICLAIVVVSAIPFGELANSDHPLSTVIEKRFGHTGAIVLAIIALFSTSNSLLSNMLGASRVFYTIGKENKKVSWLSKVSEKRNTPIPALILVACISAAFASIGNVESVAQIANFFVLISFIVINVTVIYIRVKHPKKKSPFRIPGNIKNIPVISVVAILMVLVLTGFNIYGILS